MIASDKEDEERLRAEMLRDGVLVRETSGAIAARDEAPPEPSIHTDGANAHGEDHQNLKTESAGARGSSRRRWRKAINAARCFASLSRSLPAQDGRSVLAHACYGGCFSSDGEALVLATLDGAKEFVNAQLQPIDLDSDRSQDAAADAKINCVHFAQISACHVSPDGSLWAFGANAGAVAVCEGTPGHKLVWKDTSITCGWVQDVAFSRDGELLACQRTTGEGGIAVYAARTGNVLTTLDAVCHAAFAVTHPYDYSLGFSDALLVAALGGVDHRCVGVWRVQHLNETHNNKAPFYKLEPRITDDARDGVGPVAISSESSSKVVIGTLRGQVLLYSELPALGNPQRTGFESGESFGLPSWDSVCVHAALGASANDAHCRAVVFNPGNAQFAVAWANGDVKVFDVGSTACVAAFAHEGTVGNGLDNMVLAFSPDGGRLACGGGSMPRVWFHGVAPVRTTRFRVTENVNAERLTDAAVSAVYVAIAYGDRIAVLNRADGKEVCVIHAESRVESFFDGALGSVCLHPESTHVVFVAKLVYCHALPSGDLAASLAYKIDFGDVWAATFSPSGSMLCVTSWSKGNAVFDAASGQLVRTLGSAPAVGLCAYPSDRLVLESQSHGVDAGNFPAVSETNLSTGVTRRLDDEASCPCVDDAGGRMACMRQKPFAIVIRELATGNPREIMDRHAGHCTTGFSPGGGEFLALTETVASDTGEGCSLAVLDAASGEDAVWSRYLPLVFAGGFTPAGSFHWAQPSKSRSRVLHAVVGPEVVCVDVRTWAGNAEAQIDHV